MTAGFFVSIASALYATPPAQPTFQAPQHYATGGQNAVRVIASTVAPLTTQANGTVDARFPINFSQQGNQDVVEADGASKTITIKRGNASGSAFTDFTITAADAPTDMVVADFDADGKPDIAIAAGGKLVVYLNTYDGDSTSNPNHDLSFAAPVSYTAHDSNGDDVNIKSIAVANLAFQNNNAHPDIVGGTSTYDADQDEFHGVLVRFHNSNGDFSNAETYVLPAGSGADCVAAADMDNDGFDDVVTGGLGSGTVTVVKNFESTSGGFSHRSIDPADASAVEPVSYGVGHPVSAIAIGDVTADGARDVLVLYGSIGTVDGQPVASSTLLLFANDGTGALAGYTSVLLKNGVPMTGTGVDGSIAIGDLNGDGQPAEIAVADGLNDQISIVTTNAALTASNHVFTTALSSITTANAARRVDIGDLNKDNKLDLFVANSSSTNNASLLLNGVSTGGGGTDNSLHFHSDTYFVNADGSEAMIVIDRGADSTGTVTVKFTVGGTAVVFNGSNAATCDYTVDSAPGVTFNSGTKTGTVTFGAGVFSKTILLAVSNKPAPSPDKTVTLTLSNATGDAALDDPDSAEVTIHNPHTLAVRPPGPLTVAPLNVIRHTPAQLKALGVKAEGRNGSDWVFAVSQPLDLRAQDQTVKVQYSFVPPPNLQWQDLGLTLTHVKGPLWVGKTPAIPQCSKIYFRTVTGASNLAETAGKTVGPFKVIDGPSLTLSVKQATQRDKYNDNLYVAGPIDTHNDEDITYRFHVENKGNADATDAVIYIPIPAHTHFAAAQQPHWPGSTLTQLTAHGRVTNSATDTAILTWKFSNLPAHASDTLDLVVTVDSAAEFNAKVPTASFGAVLALQKFDVSAPSQNIGRIPGDPAVLKATVRSPLDIQISAIAAGDSPNIATVGSTITYKVTLSNLAGFDYREAKFTDRVPVGTALESVASQTSGGNFDGPALTHPTPGTNPSVPDFAFGSQQLITWNVGTIPAHGQRTLTFTVRTLFDLPSFYMDAQGVSHTTEVANNEYNLIATPPSGGTIPAFSKATDGKPARTLISAADPAALPVIRFEKETTGEGNGGGELRVGNTDVATVLPNDPVKYTLHYGNTGGSTARGCVIQEEIAKGATFIGFMQLNGQDLNQFQYLLRDFRGTVLPYPGHSLEQDLKAAKLIEFRLGDLAPGQTGELSYKVAAAVPVNTLISSNSYRMWTESLSKPAAGSPAPALAKTVLPISFDVETRPDKTKVQPGDTLSYTISFVNNGGVASFNTVVSCPLPADTSFVSAQFLDANLQPMDGDVVAPSAANGNVCQFKVGVLNARPDAGQPDDPQNHGIVRLKVQVNNPLPVALRRPDAVILTKAAINGTYPRGAAAQQREFAVQRAGGAAPMLAGLPGLDTAATPIQVPNGPHLWAMKTYPQFVTAGQKLLYRIVWGNSGDAAVRNVRCGIQIPYGTTVVASDTTPGYTLAKGIVTWNFGDLAPHDAGGCILVVRVLPGVSFRDDTLEENSCYVDSADIGAVKGNSPQVVPGPARTTVLSTSPVVAGWQALGAFFKGIGANLFGGGSSQLDSSVHQFSANSINTTLRGADLIGLQNGAIIIPNLGNKIVASGAGNLISNDGAGLVAAGAGNLVAAGGGNLVAAGAGNLITVAGIGPCTTANLVSAVQGIVASGAGNIVAAGGGNLIGNDGATLIGNDGAGVISNDGHSFVQIDPHAANLVAAGGGNIVAAGAGNIVAAGGGNLVAAGGGNLLANKPGFVALVNPNGAGVISAGANPLIGNDGAGLIGNDGAGLIGNDGAGLIGNDGAGLAPKVQP